MKSAVDRAGRIAVPKAIREATGLSPGVPVKIRLVEGHIEIEPARAAVRLERRGRLLVAVPRGPQPRLTSEAAEAARRGLRRDRGVPSWSGVRFFHMDS